ncbi:MAG: hypothetical protein AB1656_21200 [Candidatus Omnitrophota bacterium]
MKQWAYRLGLVLLAVSFVAGSVLAQPAPGQGRGFGRFLFNPDEGNFICDYLLLDKANAEKVAEAYGKAIKELSDKWMPKLEGVSGEERRTMFQEIRDESAKAKKESLGKLLSADEMKTVEPVMEMRMIQPLANLRALRLLYLEKEKRAKLQPLAAEYVKTLQEARPARQPGQQLSQEDRQKQQEEFAKKREEITKEYDGKVIALLSTDEAKALKEQTAKIQEEFDKAAAAMGGGAPRRQQ